MQALATDADGEPHPRSGGSWLDKASRETSGHVGARAADQIARLRIARCRTQLNVAHCPKCSRAVANLRRCRHRFCPSCVEADTVLSWKANAWKVWAFQYPAHIVISPRTIPRGALRLAVTAIRAGWIRLKHTSTWTSSVPRAYVAWGVTLSRRHGWHPHLHILADVAWIHRPLLAQAVRVAFRLDHLPMVHVKRWTRTRDLWLEIMKGTRGDASRLHAAPGHALGEASTAFDGVKRWWYTGAFPDPTRTQGGLPVEWLEAFDQVRPSCPTCDLPYSRQWHVTRETTKATTHANLRAAAEEISADVHVGFAYHTGWDVLEAIRESELTGAPLPPWVGQRVHHVTRVPPPPPVERTLFDHAECRPPRQRGCEPPLGGRVS